MKKIVILLLSVAAVAGCKNRNKATETIEVVSEVIAPADTLNVQDSLNYEGTYKGTLPCADCSGIETTITIDKNGNFTRTMKYMGKGDNNEFKDSGTFQWDSTGTIIQFQNVEDPGMYLVGKDRLTALDMDGNIITGELAEYYVLPKQN